MAIVRPILTYTVILVRPKTGESAQLSFAPKFVGEFLLIWANFVPISSQKFADLGKIRPNRQNFARIFWGEISLRGFAHFEFRLKKFTVKMFPEFTVAHYYRD
jgi:hypothetical protein